MDQLIDINGKKINTYTVGNGETTCIFLSGSAILSPKWEYMPVVNEMAKWCKVIVIEKLGYGASDLTEDPREIDTVIDEYRYIGSVLTTQKPVILMAHSMGFLEAIRWAQRFQDEIAGIIGLDPATPEAYKDFDVEKQMATLLKLSKNQMLKKLLAGITLRKLFKQRNCTEHDKQQLKNLAPTKIVNPVWISEAHYLRKNIEVINQDRAIQVPLLFFVSNGKGTTQTKKMWREHALHYLEDKEGAHYEFVEHPHNLYEYIPEEIASRSRAFVAELNLK
ncbi:MAG: alpha/beta fold hydrolase [Cellulosilyticaceae bacterium]